MADDSAADRSPHSLQDFFARIEAGLSKAAANAVVAQQQAWVAAQAAQTMGLATMYSLDTAAAGGAAAEELKKSSTAKAAE